MSSLRPAPPLDVLEVMAAERARFLDLLAGLEPGEWDAPTECPAWSVKGIALHVLGDDFSLLSRQRDGEPPGVVASVPADGWDGLTSALDAFNERWVEAASFFSPVVIIDLLRISGERTLDWYATVDPQVPGEAVHWVGPQPAPYWMIAAREYVERWVHHLQVLRAIGRSGLTDTRYVLPAVAAVVRGFPQGFALIDAKPETTVTLAVGSGGDKASWTLHKGDRAWTLHDGAPAAPSARLRIDCETAAALFSRGLARTEIAHRVATDGEPELAATVVGGIAAFFGRAATT